MARAAWHVTWQVTRGGLGEGMLVQDIDGALARVLATEPFQRSRRNSELLEHIVRSKLDGRENELNGTALAQDVFGKGADFDPANDPSVRVQMGRLRKMLRDHYATSGRDDPVRIEIPKGGYVPRFLPADLYDSRRAARAHIDTVSSTETPDLTSGANEVAGDAAAGEETLALASDPNAKPGRHFALLAAIWRPALATITIFVALALIARHLETWPFEQAVQPSALAGGNDFPVVIVRPFENRTGDPGNDAFARGFQRQFAADLQRFRTSRVALDEPPPAEGIPGVNARADFIVTGAILETDPAIDVLVWLLDVDDATLSVSERLREDPDGDYVAALDEFSSRLSSHFGSPRGRIATAALRGEGPLPQDPDELAAFRCIAEFHDFEGSADDARFWNVYRCLNDAAERLPENGTILAALSWMVLRGSPEAGLLRLEDASEEFSVERALRLAERAVAIEPANDQAHLYLGLAQWFLDREREALASMRRAVRLNPGNPIHRADYALFLALSGQWGAAMPIARDALEWDLNPPPWYRLVFFFREVMTGNGHRANFWLEQGASRADAFDSIYRLVAAVMTGDAGAIARYKPAVMALEETQQGDALLRARRWLKSPELINRMARHLEAVDVPVAGAKTGASPPT